MIRVSCSQTRTDPSAGEWAKSICGEERLLLKFLSGWVINGQQVRGSIGGHWEASYCDLPGGLAAMEPFDLSSPSYTLITWGGLGCIFIPIPKKGNAKECSNYCTIALISHASKVMLEILQARLQQYMNDKLPDVQAGFRKGRGTIDQIANIRWIIGKCKTVPEKHLFLLYWLCQSLWLCGSQ